MPAFGPHPARMSRIHRETHNLHNAGWLRAAVLGANDGLISTAGLVVGMAAAGTELKTLLLTAAAGLTAGAVKG